MEKQYDYLNFDSPSVVYRRNRFLNNESMFKFIYILLINVVSEIKMKFNIALDTVRNELLDDMKILLGKVFDRVERNLCDEYDNIPRLINIYFRNVEYFLKVLEIKDNSLLYSVIEIRFKLIALLNYKKPSNGKSISTNINDLLLILSDVLNESIEYFNKKKYYDYYIRTPLSDREVVDEHNRIEVLKRNCDLTRDDIRGSRKDLEEKKPSIKPKIRPKTKKGWFFGLFSCCGL